MATPTVETRDADPRGRPVRLVLDADLMARLGITGETVLDVRTEGRSLLVSPHAHDGEPTREAAFRASAAKMLKRYEETFRELAK